MKHYSLLHTLLRGGGRGGQCGGRDQVWDREMMFSSHHLKSGHLAWWSGDNCNIFPKVNISERRS